MCKVFGISNGYNLSLCTCLLLLLLLLFVVVVVLVVFSINFAKDGRHSPKVHNNRDNNSINDNSNNVTF